MSELRSAARTALFLGAGYYGLRALGVFKYTGRWLVIILIAALIGWNLPDDGPDTNPQVHRFYADTAFNIAAFAACGAEVNDHGWNTYPNAGKFCECEVSIVTMAVRHSYDENYKRFLIRDQCYRFLS